LCRAGSWSRTIPRVATTSVRIRTRVASSGGCTIYEEHSVDRPYLARNYKDVLVALEQENVITTKGRKSKRGFADEILVTFPRRGS